MYGVVLWSDRAECKAVIWCEDHGELAYYVHSPDSLHEGKLLDAGDLIHFQLENGPHMRLAQNPELVSEQHAPEIAEKLRRATPERSQEPTVSSESEGGETKGIVISFPKLCTA